MGIAALEKFLMKAAASGKKGAKELTDIYRSMMKKEIIENISNAPPRVSPLSDSYVADFVGREKTLKTYEKMVSEIPNIKPNIEIDREIEKKAQDLWKRRLKGFRSRSTESESWRFNRNLADMGVEAAILDYLKKSGK